MCEDKRVKYCMVCEDHGGICFAFFFFFFCECGRQKPEDPQFEPPWLTMPLHGVVYEVWDLPCISMLAPLFTLPTHFGQIKMAD